MQFAFDDYVIDSTLREVRCRDEVVHAEPQVFDLLLHLLRNRDRLVTIDELIDTVWEGRHVSESTIRNRINAARKLIGDDGGRQALIRTLPRKGLRFVGIVAEEADGARNAGTDVAGSNKRESAPVADALLATPGRETTKPIVAVLPFTNLGGDPLHEHIADGLSEDIITILAKHRSLTVIARNSVFAFKGRAGDVRMAGAELGADYVVEGSVRRLGDNLRVTAHLIQTASGQLMWADRLDRPMEALFEMQDEITNTIVANIEPQIGSVERAVAACRRPSSLKAWGMMQLGITHLYRANLKDNLEAQRFLKSACDQDPGLAQAHAHLAYAILLSMLYFDVEPEEERLAEAHDRARHAMELDDQDAMVRFVYGRVLLAQRSYTDALLELEQSVTLNPALAIGYCGVADSLAYEGRYSEAFPYFQRAIELSPHDPQRWAFHAYRALAHLFARQFRLSADWARKATHVPNCHYWPFAHRVAALGHLGEEDECESALKALLAKRPGFSRRMARQRLFYIKDSAQLDLYVEGLKKAGVPA